MPRTVPLEQCSEAYQRYHEVPGIKAAFVKDKYIVDSLIVDATSLFVDDTLVWHNLLNDFGVSDEGIQDMMYSTKDKHHLFVRACPKGDYTARPDPDYSKNEIVAIFPLSQKLVILHPQDENQADTLCFQLHFNTTIQL